MDPTNNIILPQSWLRPLAEVGIVVPGFEEQPLELPGGRPQPGLVPPLGAEPPLQRLVPAVLGLGEGHPALAAQVHALVAAAALHTGSLVELSTKQYSMRVVFECVVCLEGVFHKKKAQAK